MADKPKEDMPKVGSKISFHYQKSPEYRTIHSDGCYGSITPRGYISMTFYNERNVLPRITSRVVLEAKTSGELIAAPEVIEDSLSGVMRQLEATVFMDAVTAREFYDWFGLKLASLEEHIGTAPPLNSDKDTKP